MKADLVKALSRWTELNAVCDALLKLERRDPRALKDKGLALRMLGDPEHALKVFEAALAVDVDDLEALRGQRDCLKAMNQPELVARVTREILHLDPRDLRSRLPPPA